MPERTEPCPPLLILPLPADVRLAAAVLGAAGDWWADRYGEPLVIHTDPDATNPLRQEEDTPYGRALVLRQPPEGGGDHA
jgi:hypothetical protein